MSELAVALLFAALIAPPAPTGVNAPQEATSAVACSAGKADGAMRGARDKAKPAAAACAGSPPKSAGSPAAAAK